MRTWGRSEITSYCFFVWCKSSSSLRFKSKGSILCALFRLKSRSSGGDRNVSRMTLHEFGITFFGIVG